MTVLSNIRSVRFREPPSPQQANTADVKTLGSAVSTLITVVTDMATTVAREIIPVVREMRSRYNERHGSIVVTDSDYTVVEPVETVISTAAITVTLPDTSAPWFRYVRLVANGGDITLAVQGSDTLAGPATVTAGTSEVYVPANANWY